MAEALQVSIAELLTGDVVKNENTSGNMKKMSFYVCPICANVIQSVGEGAFCCCGITLPRLEEEEKDDIHMPQVEVMDGEFHVFLEHEMTKEHYISFFAYVTSNYAQFVKLYPEQNAECRFTRRGMALSMLIATGTGYIKCWSNVSIRHPEGHSGCLFVIDGE